ncbi:hypothetical protein D3C72_2349360 [compost metagenome]
MPFGKTITAIIELDCDIVKFAGFQCFRIFVAIAVGQVENLITDTCDTAIRQDVVEAQ